MFFTAYIGRYVSVALCSASACLIKMSVGGIFACDDLSVGAISKESEEQSFIGQAS